jgi:hypothetical protein
MLLFGILAIAFFLGGCAPTTRIMDYKDIKTDVAMSEAIFLSPTNAEKTICVQVRNTSSNQSVTPEFEQVVLAQLQNKGYRIVSNPAEATYILQPIIRYCGEWKEGSVGEGMGAGAALGALTGIGLASNSSLKHFGQATAAGTLIGAGIGLALDLATRVKVEVLLIDFQIVEQLGTKDIVKIETKQTKTKTSSKKKGGLAKKDPPTQSTTQTTVSSKKEGTNVFQAGVAAKAGQIGLDSAQAAQAMAVAAARQIAGIF